MHEVLLVPDWGCQAEALKKMLREVNDTMLEEKFILSYHIYQYDIVTEEITDVYKEQEKGEKSS